MDKNKVKFWIDLSMFASFVIAAISGFVLWFIYPAGEQSGRADIRFLFNRFGWLKIHNFFSVLLIILLVIHLVLNWQWIKAMFKRSFRRENRKY